MLDGVTILSEGVYTVATAGWGFPVVLMIILAILIVMMSIITYIGTDEPANLLIILFALFPLLFATILYDVSGPTLEYPKYKVTIDETVNFTEFMERYEILSQDGLIYEITEKRADTN